LGWRPERRWRSQNEATSLALKLGTRGSSSLRSKGRPRGLNRLRCQRAETAEHASAGRRLKNQCNSVQSGAIGRHAKCRTQNAVPPDSFLPLVGQKWSELLRGTRGSGFKIGFRRSWRVLITTRNYYSRDAEMRGPGDVGMRGALEGPSHS